MTIAFTEVPSDNRSPAAFVELDDSQTGASSGSVDHILLLGHQVTGGSATANAIVDLTTIAEAEAAFGKRSMLAAMMRAMLPVNDQATYHAMAISDGGAAASGKYTVVGTATAAGSIEVTVGDKSYLVPVAVGASETVVAAAIKAVLDADLEIPVTAAVVAGVCTLTAAWKGPTGAETLLTVTVGTVPAGLTCVATTMSGGGAAASISGAVAALEADPYMIATGVADTTALALLETEIATRWQAGSILGGHVYYSVSGNRTTAQAFGVLRNAAESTLIPTLDSPTQPWLWAGVLCAADVSLAVGQSRYELPLPGLTPPAPASRAQTNGQRNVLLKNGCSTWLVSSGKVLVDRLITTYQRDSGGSPDTAWLSLYARQVVWMLRQDWRKRTKDAFVGGLVADDGTLIAEGSRITTPTRIKAEAVAWFGEKLRAGLVEKAADFKAALIAERNLTDPTRVDMIITPDLVNELVTLATKLAFKL